jgi:hypothetical protein
MTTNAYGRRIASLMIRMLCNNILRTTARSRRIVTFSNQLTLGVGSSPGRPHDTDAI